MARFRLALFSCVCLLVACQASLPEQSRANNSGDIERNIPAAQARPKHADNSDDLERDVAAAEASPEVCATIGVDGERRVICCPRDKVVYDVATQRCVAPRVQPVDPPEPPPLRFTERLRELEACKQGIWKQPGALAQSQGRCADGRRFFEQTSFLSGWVEFYRGEQWVGASTWTDYGGKSADGDADCVVVERGGLCGTPLHFFSPVHSVQAVDD